MINKNTLKIPSVAQQLANGTECAVPVARIQISVAVNYARGFHNVTLFVVASTVVYGKL